MASSITSKIHETRVSKVLVDVEAATEHRFVAGLGRLQRVVLFVLVPIPLHLETRRRL